MAKVKEGRIDKGMTFCNRRVKGLSIGLGKELIEVCKVLSNKISADPL